MDAPTVPAQSRDSCRTPTHYNSALSGIASVARGTGAARLSGTQQRTQRGVSSMIISPTDLEVADLEADAIVVGVDAQGTLTKEAQEVDAATGGLLARLVAQRGDLRQTGQGRACCWLRRASRPGKSPSSAWARARQFGRGQAFRAAAAAAKRLAERPRRRVAFFLGDGWTEQQVESGVCGAMVGCRGQDLYRTEKNLHPIEEILWDDAYEAVLDRRPDPGGMRSI